MDEQTVPRAMLSGREPTKEEFAQCLCLLHDAKRLWRACPNKDCKRARRCRGNLEESIRAFPATAHWQLELINALRAGVRSDAATKQADRIAYGITE